jgi:hypothetical protein
VRTLNSRAWSTALERRLGAALPHAGFAGTVAELEQRLDEFCSWRGEASEWLLKGNFSNAGRSQLRGRGPLSTILQRQRAWIQAHIEAEGGVALEPLVSITEEAGILWEVPTIGAPVLIGVVPQLCDARGQYRGSLVTPASRLTSRWEEAVAVSRLAAAEIQSLGYHGPLGIDACWYRDSGGNSRCRPLQDVNARWTMGRLSLGWSDLLQPGELGLFEQSARVSLGTDKKPVRSFRITPGSLSGRPVGIEQTFAILPASG